MLWEPILITSYNSGLQCLVSMRSPFLDIKINSLMGRHVFSALSFLLLEGAWDKAQEWTTLSASQRSTIKSQYAAAGIKLIVSAFGSTDVPTSSGVDPIATANTMAAWVKQYDLDGIDVDYEVCMNRSYTCYGANTENVSRISMRSTPALAPRKTGLSPSLSSFARSCLPGSTSLLMLVSFPILWSHREVFDLIFYVFHSPCTLV